MGLPIAYLKENANGCIPEAGRIARVLVRKNVDPQCVNPAFRQPYAQKYVIL